MDTPLHLIDVGIILLYFVILLFLGLFRNKKQSQSEHDYLLAGRRLSLIPFSASLVATWYGGILGVGEFTYLYGFSNWVVFGLPYYLFAILYAVFIAEKIQSKQAITIPDRFYSQYGKIPGVISAIYVMILSSPAPYILSVGIILDLIFDLGLLLSLFLSTLFSMVYIYRGGLKSVIRTDLLQFGLMFLGFIIIVALSAKEFGGFSTLKNSLPPDHFTWRGGNSTFYILVWFFIALWTFIDPGFYQRCTAASSPATAKKGILLSIIFWGIFDFLTLSTGLYARMALPDLKDPLLAIPTFGTVILPPVAMGLFFVGLLATIMSTIDSFGFISAITFGRDIMWRVRKKKENPIKWTQIGLLVTGVISLLFAWLLPSVVDLWYAIGSVVVPGLLIPFLTTFQERNTLPGMAWMMAVPTGVSLLWFLVGVSSGGELPAYPFGIEPFYPGIIVSFIWWIIIRSKRQ
ncbi:MAG: sodium:solute symporter family protein [Candidatus Marinimicrobia bacterium]|nr:sodium:solute symporter family protein [Candidatus Neomarinimicrobiota bacterium]